NPRITCCEIMRLTAWLTGKPRLRCTPIAEDPLNYFMCWGMSPGFSVRTITGKREPRHESQELPQVSHVHAQRHDPRTPRPPRRAARERRTAARARDHSSPARENKGRVELRYL